ncbi:MAG: AMP-binding protein, partial [Nitrospira sp.]|nr:AMP-binding protein [Nitrospira sp.]
GLISYICVVTAAAGEILLEPRFDSRTLLNQIADKRPTILTAIPTMLTALLSTPGVEDLNWEGIKHVISGGAAVPLELNRCFTELTGIVVQQSYGMTKTSGTATCIPADGGPVESTTSGFALPEVLVEIRSLSDPDTSLAQGEIGEICIGGPNLMDGYWKIDNAQELYTSDGLFRSGDIGFIGTDGQLSVTDRVKDMVICSGYNVYPRVIDEALVQHPAVYEAIAIGMPDTYRGETIVAVLALRPGQSLSFSDLQTFLRDKLSPVEMPKHMVILGTIPKTENGKLSRKLVRDLLLSTPEHISSAPASR